MLPRVRYAVVAAGMANGSKFWLSDLGDCVMLLIIFWSIRPWALKVRHGRELWNSPDNVHINLKQRQTSGSIILAGIVSKLSLW